VRSDKALRDFEAAMLANTTFTKLRCIQMPEPVPIVRFSFYYYGRRL